MDKLKPGIFLDRDGVINERIVDGYVLKWEDFKFMPDAIKALKLLYSTGLPLFVVSNQQCINIGLIKYYQVEVIMELMKIQLKDNHIMVRAMICPHTKEEHCSCRKPNPGMLYYLARINDICLEDSYIIGDSWTDIEAGYRAMVKHRLKLSYDLDLWPHNDINKPLQHSNIGPVNYMRGALEFKTFLSAAQWIKDNEELRRNEK